MTAATAKEKMTAALSIAVADDEPRMRDYYCSTLPLLGHRVVVVAQDGCEMVERCRNTRPDLIITDIKMPDMDGIDAVREICGVEPIPIILVSAYHDVDLLDRARREHTLAYLVKPIKQADLEAAISVAMQRFEEFRAVQGGGRAAWGPRRSQGHRAGEGYPDEEGRPGRARSLPPLAEASPRPKSEDGRGCPDDSAGRQGIPAGLSTTPRKKGNRLQSRNAEEFRERSSGPGGPRGLLPWGPGKEVALPPPPPLRSSFARRDSYPQGFSERLQSSSLFLPSKAYLTQGHHT